MDLVSLWFNIFTDQYVLFKIYIEYKKIEIKHKKSFVYELLDYQNKEKLKYRVLYINQFRVNNTI